MQEGTKTLGIERTVSISYSDVVHMSLQLFLWNMMFEWQTLLESGDLPTPACSDLYYASEERAVSLRRSPVSLVCIIPDLLYFNPFMYMYAGTQYNECSR